MAGALDALASYIQSMVLEMATEELKMLVQVSGEIDNMSIKLRDIQNFLADADRKKITDQSVQEFVRELRDAMYDATDILDLCQLKAMEQGPRRCDAGCFNPLLFCMRNPLHAHNIGSRIKNLNSKLDAIKARSASFDFIKLDTYEDSGRNGVSYGSSSRETSGGLDESGLVGEKIKEDTTNLVDMLTWKYPPDDDRSKNIMVFSIVGVGGIGKTTLAQKIFNNEVIKHEFTKKIWLSVNQGFSDTEMLKRVIIQAGGNHTARGNSKAALEQTLIEALGGQKTLLVMDDVWDSRIWEGVLRTPFVNAKLAQGSRVLVTTRHHTVARGMMAEEPYHRIDKLGHEDAWLLVKKQVARDTNDESQVEILKDIGIRLVEKCDCLPLAVKVMGGLLRQKRISRTDWENVIDDSLWSEPEMPKELNYAIYLSYENLHPHLKPCFLHYSLLPRGTLFSADDIIGMWISEGFVHGTSDDLEEIGRKYYDELIQRNLIEPNIRHVDQKVCNMHDIVRSFAQYVFGDEALIAHNSETGISDKLKSQKFVRLSLENKGSQPCNVEWCSLQTQTSLRTLISVGNIIKINPGDSFLFCSSLRTLYLDSSNFDALAESLYQLKHLRYLSIENSDISMLPENIGKMKFLQYISLSGCKRLAKLPGTIVKLQDLRYLRLHRNKVMVMPRDFGGLTSLRKLYGFPVQMDSDHCSLEELGPLSRLTELGIHFLENATSSSSARKAKLVEKKRLRSLTLCCTSIFGNDDWVEKLEAIPEEDKRRIEEVFDELCPPLCLETLTIKGYFGQRLPGWMMPTEVTRSLRVLLMDDLACCTDAPRGLCQLQFLEILQVRNAPWISCIGLEFVQPSNPVGAGFPKLQYMKFSGFIQWEEWVWEEQVKAMPMLYSLQLEACNLYRLPPGLPFQAMALKNLYILDCRHLRCLENFPCVVNLELARNKCLERISNFPKLQRLVIVFCPNMKVLEGTPALQRFNLEDPSMETIPRYLQNVNPRNLQLDCSFPLLKCIAVGKSSPEWDKFSHIQEVKAYADHVYAHRMWYVLYTRDPLSLNTNISRSEIAKDRKRRTRLAEEKCPIDDEWPAGVERYMYEDKRAPLCVRFRYNALRHLVLWVREACLHCSEISSTASKSYQWTEDAPMFFACTRVTYE